MRTYSSNSATMQHYKNSAFKPVLTGHRTQVSSENLNSIVVPNANSTTRTNDTMNTVVNSDDECNNNTNAKSRKRGSRRSNGTGTANNEYCEAVNNDNESAENPSSDEEMVDIETTDVVELTERRMELTEQHIDSNERHNSQDSRCRSDAAVDLDDEVSGMTSERALRSDQVLSNASISPISDSNIVNISGNVLNNNNNNNNNKTNNNCVVAAEKHSIESVCSDQCNGHCERFVNDSSLSSNCSNTEIIVDNQEKDDIKPAVNHNPIVATLDSDCWINCTNSNKTNGSSRNSADCSISHQESAAIDLMSNFKKEVSLAWLN